MSEERKVGHWELHTCKDWKKKGDGLCNEQFYSYYTCPFCKFLKTAAISYNYCPECGADLRGSGDDYWHRIEINDLRKITEGGKNE